MSDGGAAQWQRDATAAAIMAGDKSPDIHTEDFDKQPASVRNRYRPSLEDTLGAILDQLQQINATLDAQGKGSSERVSSVEVKTSTRGVDISCKAYTDSEIEPAGNAATAEFKRVRALMEDRLMDGFKEAVQKP